MNIPINIQRYLFEVTLKHLEKNNSNKITLDVYIF